jgi:hypothetical protein
MRQEPHGQGGRTLAALGIWRSVVEITIDVENVNVFPGDAPQRPSRSNHQAAIAADQQRDMPRLAQNGPDPLPHAVPGDPWTGPASDRRDRVMRKIAGNRHIAVIDCSTARRSQAGEQLSVAIGLSVVFVARIQ